MEKYLVPDRSVFVPIYQQTKLQALLKPTKQIAIFGGSSVHGGSIGVSSSNEFAGILNQRLPIQVNNFGAPSLDSHDILRISKELIQFFAQPVGFSTRDIMILEMLFSTALSRMGKYPAKPYEIYFGKESDLSLDEE